MLNYCRVQWSLQLHGAENVSYVKTVFSLCGWLFTVGRNKKAYLNVPFVGRGAVVGKIPTPTLSIDCSVCVICVQLLLTVYQGFISFCLVLLPHWLQMLFPLQCFENRQADLCKQGITLWQRRLLNRKFEWSRCLIGRLGRVQRSNRSVSHNQGSSRERKTHTMPWNIRTNIEICPVRHVCLVEFILFYQGIARLFILLNPRKWNKSTEQLFFILFTSTETRTPKLPTPHKSFGPQ